MRASRLPTMRGVKARMINARSLVCRGGSKKMNHSGFPRPATDMLELNASWSFTARFTPS